MKRTIKFAIAAAFLAVGLSIFFVDAPETMTHAQTTAQTIPDVIVLGKDVKLGPVTFNHAKHNGGTYSIDGTGPIACIECHHVSQPAAEAAKHPPMKTAWPADRTTTLTQATFTADPAKAAVAACRDCHAKTGETPKLVPAIPQIKHESSTAMITLVNQQAFHRNCTHCHTEIKKTNPAAKGPTAMQCTMCHKKAA